MKNRMKTPIAIERVDVKLFVGAELQWTIRGYSAHGKNRPHITSKAGYDFPRLEAEDTFVGSDEEKKALELRTLVDHFALKTTRSVGVETQPSRLEDPRVLLCRQGAAVVASMPIRLPLHQSGISQQFQHPQQSTLAFFE